MFDIVEYKNKIHNFAGKQITKDLLFEAEALRSLIVDDIQKNNLQYLFSFEKLNKTEYEYLVLTSITDLLNNIDFIIIKCNNSLFPETKEYNKNREKHLRDICNHDILYSLIN